MSMSSYLGSRLASIHVFIAELLGSSWTYFVILDLAYKVTSKYFLWEGSRSASPPFHDDYM